MDVTTEMTVMSVNCHEDGLLTMKTDVTKEMTMTLKTIGDHNGIDCHDDSQLNIRAIQINISQISPTMAILSPIILATLFGLAIGGLAPIPGFRPPSVPLITMDPYMNVWAMSKNLYDDYTQYWDAGIQQFTGIIRIDGDAYRFMGTYGSSLFMSQQSMTVWPTRTIYQFEDPSGRVGLNVQFTTPALPKQWDISSRPVTYITYNVSSVDGEQHSVKLYYDNTGEIAVNSESQKITWSRFEVSATGEVYSVMQIGSASQDYLGTTGDAVVIDWGYAYVAVAQEAGTTTVMANGTDARNSFIYNGTLPPNDDTNFPRPCDIGWPSLIVAWDFYVDGSSSVTKFITFAYDDVYSIEYFGQAFQPYWRRPAMDATVETLLVSAITDYSTLLQQCEQFDTQLVQDLEAKGGAEYATLAALAYRQTTAGTKLVYNDQLQTPWVFLKEISSGGELSAVNVMAAASPFFIYHDPEYLQLFLLPILAYANNETGNALYNYPFSWAPHHLGKYPVADVQPNQQENMPMEETGNMLIMLAAVTQKLGVNSTSLWYPRYWPLLQSWADYLVSVLPDPEDQTFTDDFDSSYPHNANLAIKGIVGLGAFAELCRILGLDSDYDYYTIQASNFASQWVDLAFDGDHYRRQYDLNDTWSLKYNLLCERMLGLSIFPPDVVPTEVSYYLNSQLKTYGIPLDDRNTRAKLDWNAWVAAMTSDTNQQTLIFKTLYNWANMTSAFLPLTDFYDSVSGNRDGYMARPVVGALYALMLF